jgi:hypothetical protein
MSLIAGSRQHRLLEGQRYLGRPTGPHAGLQRTADSREPALRSARMEGLGITVTLPVRLV